jgi:hypothetical protein
MDNGRQYEQHEMIVTQEYPNGAQEFYCPTCGRRFVLHWPPAYKRIVLDPGNENAIHSGSTAGVSLEVSSVAPQTEEQSDDRTGEMDDPYLALWAKYLDENFEF